MAPSATSPPPAEDPTILALRKTLTSESSPLALRFRALFSLKHLACQASLPAIHAIAAAFSSPSALLKHELAYCLGQTKNLAAVPYLRTVLEDVEEDAMCRHEAAEALGAIGDTGSLDVLREFRDRTGEKVVVKETCEIAVARIEWENSEKGKAEKLRQRWVHIHIHVYNKGRDVLIFLVTLLQLILHLRWISRNRSRVWRSHCWIRSFHCS